MKAVRLLSTAVGALSVAFGLTSCKEETECCSYSESYTDDYDNDISYSLEACEDGSFSYSYSYNGATYSYSGDFTNEDLSWSYVRSYITLAGGSCD